MIESAFTITIMKFTDPEFLIHDANYRITIESDDYRYSHMAPFNAFVDVLRERFPQGYKLLRELFIDPSLHRKLALNKGISTQALGTLRIWINDNVRYMNHREQTISFDAIDHIVELFTHEVETDIPDVGFMIPPYNVFHYGNICHLNVCINLITSMITVARDILCASEEELHEDPKLIAIQNIVRTSFDEVDINPLMVYELMECFNITMDDIVDATFTMNQLYQSFSELLTDDVMKWWGTSIVNGIEDIPTKESFDETTERYIIMETQFLVPILNITNGIPYTINIGGHPYEMFALVVHNGPHFTTLFRNGTSETFTVRNDMCHREYTSNIHISSLIGTVVMNAYIRK